MEKDTSYGKIIRSSSITGGASFVTILISILRTKLVALLLGPSGIGLVSLLIVIMETMTTLAGLGMSSSGVRQVAEAHEKKDSQNLISHALLIANAALGLAGAFVLWQSREYLSHFVFGNTAHGNEIAWLGVGVFLSTLAASQAAVLQGMRQIADLAKISVISAILAACFGMPAIWLYGVDAIPAFIVLGPFFSFATSGLYLSRKIRFRDLHYKLGDFYPHWKAMLSLGVVLMLTTLMANATQLATRSLITHDLGVEATGHFQASWSITMQYIGFILAAMSTDYYPRLTQALGDLDRANLLVNEQIEMGLLIAAPLITIMLALAPWVISLLYSNEFGDSVSVLRWQVMGDILKIASWPMSFVLAAMARRKLFFTTQISWNAVYLLLVFFGLPLFGLQITGIAFFLCYLLDIVLNYFITRKINNFHLAKYNLALLTTILISSALIFAMSAISEMLAATAGLVISISFGIYSLRRIINLTGNSSNGNFVKRFISRIKYK